MKKVWKSKRFTVGFLFISLLLAASLSYDWFFQNDVPKAELRYIDGEVQTPPYSPWDYPPFGTNNLGESLFHVLLIGAKYTLGVALLIALLRFVLSVVVGTVSEMYAPKWTEKIRPWIEAFYYYPVTLIAFLMLQWLLFQDGMFDGTDAEFTYSFNTRVIVEVSVLTLIAMPITSLTIANEVKQIKLKEFMESVQILGGGRFHVLKKHVMPFLKPQLIVVFLREVIQVLVLLAHLGILGIFFGGGDQKKDLFDNNVFVSLSNEWSGLIGNNFAFLFTTYWWMAIAPILMLTLAVLAFKLMVEGYLTVQKQPSNTDSREYIEEKQVVGEPFEWLHESDHRVSND
ncbi:ABC transporter permease [Halobacillus salinus]|uniref:ABC transporter permease n=1 Tax=Halobacillus salinus TaxID=192814 RepID=UPI0009A6D954|nr:ABC transporter permease subunit [Halobacillus salinus]